MTRTPRFIVGATLATLAACAVLAEPSARQLRLARNYSVQAERALRVGNLSTAERHLTRALEAVPGFSPAHLGLGHVALARQRYAEALDSYRAALDGFAETTRLILAFEGRRYGEASRRVQALYDEIQYLLSPASKFPPTWIARRVREAQTEIHRLESLPQPDGMAVESPPGEIHFFVGNALFHLARFDEALDEWERCREQRPAFALVYNNLAVAYWMRGRLEDARSSVERAEALGFRVSAEFRAELTAAYQRSPGR